MKIAMTNTHPGAQERRKPFSSRETFGRMCQTVENYCKVIDYTNFDKCEDIIRLLVDISGCPGAYLNYRGAINHFLRYIEFQRVPIQSIRSSDISEFWEHRCTSLCLPAHTQKGRAKFIAISRFILFLQYQEILPVNGVVINDVQLCTRFRDTIERLGIGTEPANAQARQALHFRIWLRLHGIAHAAINDKVLDDFFAHDCRCGLHMSSGCATGQARARRRIAVKRFLRFLEDQNPIFLDDVYITDRKRLNPLPSALRYQTWLRERRGLQERTVYWYVIDLMRWLPKIGEDAKDYTAESLRALAISEFRCRNPAMQSRFINSVRNYIRFRASEGDCSPSLVDALISRPSYRLSTVPRRLDSGMVSTIINSCDLDNARGIRERAILTLLAQLGLRAAEVWRLRLEDFNWSEASIRIKGKGGRGAAVPLTQDVGDAILDYLERARPPSDSDVLFLRNRRPYTPLARPAEISNIACFALARCGQKGGAHVFRHTLATELLRGGRSLEDIATVLRHRSVTTTMIYAKVDEPMLKRLAQPWMGEQR